MAKSTPTCGSKRNSLSRGEDGLDLPLNKRMQSPVVMTGPDGKILTKNRNGENFEFWSARSKFDSTKAKQGISLRQGESAADISSYATKKKPSCMRQPTFSTPQPEKVKTVHFQTPVSNFPTPGDSPLSVSKNPAGTVEYASTPLPSSKARPPLSGRKLKIKAAATLQMLDDHEIQASRLVQARLDFSMGRQERAYIAWLNHVLSKSAAGGFQTSTYENTVSDNASLDVLRTDSGADDFSMIDEVYWDEDCENASPCNQFSVGRSPRSALKPLNGLANRNVDSPGAKRPLKDTFNSSTSGKSLLARTESPATPFLSSKRLKMITEYGFSYSRDLHMQDVSRLSDLAQRLKLHFCQNEREEILTTITQLAKVSLRKKLPHTLTGPPLEIAEELLRAEVVLQKREQLQMQSPGIILPETRLKTAVGMVANWYRVCASCVQHIDEGRLRMKKGCAILGDVALRRKALYVLLNYNAYWLKIGLHVVLGHTALLKEKLSEDVQGIGQKYLVSEEYALLEVFLERHFFAHAGLSKAYASNRAVDGLYRDGYTEGLGRVILKRFFLLVLVLDKAKRQTSLKISDGIDGLDGGSPSLFRPDARVKSSRQVLQEFLSDVMHGEGDVITNLGNLGYHVYHQQVPLADYDFAVVDLIEDLQDGVRLCRLVQLLAASDTFILEHIQVPSSGRKRQLHNCQIALESLAQAGVPLEDEEGCSISAEDIVGGNKDKVFPLLWNIMVHLQIPLLVSRPRLCHEIAKLQGTEGGYALGLNIGTVELLLKWTQVACMISGNLNIRNFKTSFADGQALCYIVNLYLPLFLPLSDVLRPHYHLNVQVDSTPNLRGPFSPAYKKAVAHNFGLVQAVACRLGNIPEVLQLVDLLGDPAMSEKNIIIFVAFLCSRLLREEQLGIQVQERRDSIGWEAQESHPVPDDGAPGLCSYYSRCSLESESPVGFNRSYTVLWPKDEARRSDTTLPSFSSDICCHLKVNNPAPEAGYNAEHLRLLCKLQARWRGRKAREQFLREKRAVQTIQRSWRSFSETVQTHYATKIQAHWRGYLLRQTFLRWKEAAIIYRECHEREHAAQVIQAYYRAWIQKRKYLETVSAMCKIQALWWATEARGNFLLQWKAVRTIESAWIVYLARKRSHYAPSILPQWHQFRQSLIRLSTASSLNQSWFRDHVEDYDDDEYKMMNVQDWLQDSQLQSTDYYIAVIQAYWRARIARKRFLRQKQAALVIQRHWRKFLGRMKDTASIRIQAQWRSFRCHRKFLELKARAITVQRIYRGNIERRQCQRQRQSVIRLQARCRGLVHRTRYLATIRNIVIIQSCWRAYTVRKQFVQLKRAVSELQSRWRVYQARNVLRRRIEAATSVQTCYRGVIQRRAFVSYRKAVVMVQRVWRSGKLRKLFLQKRGSAILIQGHYRAYIQKKLEKIARHVCKIQVAWRALQIRRSYLEQRKAVVVIQTQFRAYRLGLHTRGQFLKTRAVVCIQRYYRAFRVRRDARKLINATKIQSLWRGVYVRREFLERRAAAVVIQGYFRVHLQRKAEYAVSICKVQATWRAFRERRIFLRQKGAVKLIQTHYRASVRRKSETFLRSVYKVQAIWLGLKLRSQFLLQKRAAVVIQARYRSYKIRQSFLQLKKAALIIQVSFRAFNQMRFRPIIEPAFCGTVRRICRIQAVWRAMKARRIIRAQKRAAHTIQNAWRQYLKKRQNLKRKAATVVIQAWVRGVFKRRNLERARESALVIQVHVKGWIQRNRYREALGSVCRIQAQFRARKVRVLYVRQKEAATKIQAAWRGTLCRRTVCKWRIASTKIQAQFRGFSQRNRFKRDNKAIVQCQALIRGHLVPQATESTNVGTYKSEAVWSEADCIAAVHIQSVYRGWKDRQMVRALSQAREARNRTNLEEAVDDLKKAEATEESLLPVDEKFLRSVLRLQAMFRLASASRNRSLIRKSSLRLSAPLSSQLRKGLSTEDPSVLLPDEKVLRLGVYDSKTGIRQYEYCEQGYAAMRIQACWKGHSYRKSVAHGTNRQQTECRDGVMEASIGRKKFTSHELSAGQKILGCLIFWRARSYFIKLRRAAPLIQRIVRGWLCRVKFMQTKKRIICLQAHWRGFVLRRETSQVNQELLQLRQRIQCTAATVQDSDRLGNRLTEALALLLCQKTVTGILSICRTIDLATQHSRSCCDRLAEAGAVSKILNLIQTINRSPPHEQVLKHALATLNNLANNLHLRILIAESPGAVSTISEILHMFRNKEEIFAKAMGLLKQVCELPVGIEILQRELQIFRRLQLVAQSLDRKVQVEKRNLERLLPTTSPVQRMVAEKKVTEAACQFSALMNLMKEITKRAHSQRRKTTPISVPPPSASKRVPPSCRRPSLASRPWNLGPRLPLQDRTNW